MTNKNSIFSSNRVKAYSIVGVLVLVIISVIIVKLNFSNIATIEPSKQSQPCMISEILVNSCRPWLGARANSYPYVAQNTRQQLIAHESRIGRHVDIVHVYHTAGETINDDDKTFVERPNTYLFSNWKPAANWSEGADPTNPQTTRNIDVMAQSIKNLGNHKIFLTVWHEPQNDTSGGSTKCGPSFSYKGTKGTPAQYRQMWANVRKRFVQNNVTNVIWVVDYQNYAKFDCLIDELYPGDDMVDWIVFNGYGSSSKKDYVENITAYYNKFSQNPDSSHSYSTKQLGLIEWGISNESEDVAMKYYTDAKNALDTNKFPRIKMYVVFDSIGPDKKDFRIGYKNDTTQSIAKQRAYNDFALDPRLTDAYYEK